MSGIIKGNFKKQMKKTVIGNATLYLGDCMELMAEYPDKYFDLAIVDPPYGVGSVTYMPGERISTAGGFIDKYDITVATLNMEQRRNMKVDVIHSRNTSTTMNHFGDENISPPPIYFKELFRVSKNQIIFGGNYFLLPPSRGFVVWRKHISENFSMAMCELLWTSFCANAKVVECASSGRPGERIHPTQKPIKVYEFLLKHFAKPGDKILDTHLGSGSTAVACNDLGFNLTASEMDEKYFIAACKRIEEAVSENSLCQA
jgi:site-specific DNA-methyltransferase (adenine-specific)